MTAKPRAKASAPKKKSVRRKAPAALPTKDRPARKSTRTAKKSPPAASDPATEKPTKIVRPTVEPKAKPAEPTPATTPPPAQKTTDSAKKRRRGLGSLSKHAFSPVTAPITLVLKSRPLVKMELPTDGIPASLPSDALNFLRSELAAMLAILDESSS